MMEMSHLRRTPIPEDLSTPPYFDENIALGVKGLSPAFFTPNRMVSSPGLLGSLSSRIKAGKPWTTLLFRPDPTGTHPDSAVSPPIT